MTSRKLMRRWRSRCARLLASVRRLVTDAKREGGAEQVHQLRVAIRRLRLYARLARPLLGGKVLAGLRDWSKPITQGTSVLRDCDVAVEWLENQPETEAKVILQRIQSRRARLWYAARWILDPPPSSMQRGVEGVRGGRKAERRLVERFEAQVNGLVSTVHDQMPAFFDLSDGAQHEFRRTLRWWRYLRELELGRRQQKEDRLLLCLVRIQETTGDHQNRAVVLKYLRRCKQTTQVKILDARLKSEQHECRNATREGFKEMATELKLLAGEGGPAE